MYGFKVLVVAALACVVAAHDAPHDTACVAPVTVTVTETVCGTPGVPVHTPPVAPSYEVPPPPAPPVTLVESTATAPLSGPPSQPATVIPPAPPAETGVSSVGVPPVVPSSDVVPSSGVAPSSGIKSSTASVPGTTTAPSSTAAVTQPSSPTSSTPETVSTAGAVLPTPYLGLGSLIAAGAVLNAAMAVVV